MSNETQPLPPLPERIVTTAEEWPENLVRLGGWGAASLMGRRTRGADENCLEDSARDRLETHVRHGPILEAVPTVVIEAGWPTVQVETDKKGDRRQGSPH